MSRAAKAIASFAGVASLAACSVFGSEAAPEPDYAVVVAEAPFEIRDYGELVVAKTTMEDGSRAAFGRLFAYISGENGGSRKIEMTAPVLEAGPSGGAKIDMTAPVLQGGEGGREMAFVLPDALTPESAPTPSDPRVTLATIPPRRVAVARYSGSLNGRAPAEEARLRAWLAAKDFEPVGTAETAGYNPPWTLPPYRRNEVLIPIEPGR